MRFADLVDLAEVRLLCERFTALTGAVTAVLDLEGNILIATGWHDMCTRFHRVCPVSAVRCQESDTVLAGQLREGTLWNVYECRNGLVDAAVPIFVGRQHLANFFTGQFLLSPPDTARFERQAVELGFDRDAYLAALQRVPVFTEEYARKLMDFLGGLVASFGELGLARMRAEAAAERAKLSEERFALAMDATQDGIWDWNLLTDEIYYSANYFRMLGYESNELTHSVSTWRALVHEDDWTAVQNATRNCIENRTERFELEFRMHHRDGSWRWILERGSAVTRDNSGRALRIVGTHTDVTPRHLAEDHHRQLETQLAQSQKMESIGRLAGGVAHDFNNMLAVILGHTDLALEGEQEPATIHFALTQIRQAADRSADLTRQLLTFARKREIAPVACDLNDLVGSMLVLLRRLIGENITVTWQPALGLWPVLADPSQMSQVLTNLCVNARDAISGVGTLTIETRNCLRAEGPGVAHAHAAPGEYVCLSVRDTGCGMDSETQSHIFEPFFTTRASKGGTGLGLASVYGAVKQNRGFIEVTSAPGRGALFAVWLPRHSGDMRISAVVPLRAEARFATILVVEDEPAVLALARTMLERRSYRVIGANSPSEALRLVSENPGAIDLLLTDVVMPEMTGKDLAARLISLRPELRCLYMSGYTADVIASQGVLETDVHFLAKPFTSDELDNAVSAALNGTCPAMAQVPESCSNSRDSRAGGG